MVKREDQKTKGSISKLRTANEFKTRNGWWKFYFAANKLLMEMGVKQSKRTIKPILTQKQMKIRIEWAKKEFGEHVSFGWEQNIV